MPGPTFELIASTTLGSASNNVTFSSIPQTYKHLFISQKASSTQDPTYLGLEFNGDNGGNYGSVFGAFDNNGLSYGYNYNAGNGSTGSLYNNQNLLIVHIMDYTNTTTYKGYICRTVNNWVNTNKALVQIRTGNWHNTAAITSIKMAMSDGSYSAGSIFSLYGIAG